MKMRAAYLLLFFLFAFFMSPTIAKAEELGLGYTLIVYVPPVVAAIGNLITIPGNIYALAAKKHQWGWGLAGTIMGGLGIGALVPILAWAIPQIREGNGGGGLPFVLVFGSIQIATLSLGIINLVLHSKRMNRSSPSKTSSILFKDTYIQSYQILLTME